MMRMPNESLDDFKSRIAKPPDPPPVVWLKSTGETEVLQPLARAENFVNNKAAIASAAAAPARFSRFHYALAIGAAFAMVAFILGNFLTGIYFPSVQPVSPVDVASDQHPSDTLTPPEELNGTDLWSGVESSFAFDEPNAVRKATRPRRTMPRVLNRVVNSVYRYRPTVPRPRFIVSEFVPTTLIIYIENGEIKTRIEPQLTTAYKRSLPPGGN